MRNNALVMSRSNRVGKILIAVFAELGIEYRISTSISETLDIVAANQHAALVVDFDMPDAVSVARIARMLPPKQRPVLFGAVGAATPVRDVIEAGAHFVLYKPLDLLQVLHSFRAAQGFMGQNGADLEIGRKIFSQQLRFSPSL